MLNHNNHFHVQGARPTAVFRVMGGRWRWSGPGEVFPPIKANDVKQFVFIVSWLWKKPWFRHEIEKAILCRILRNCVALSSGNAAACYLPDVTVACRHLKLRGGGTPNCLFSKRYWRMPTRDRRYGDHSWWGPNAGCAISGAPSRGSVWGGRAGNLPGELVSIPYKLSLR